VTDTLANISTFVQTKANYLSSKLSKAKEIMAKIEDLEGQCLSSERIEALKEQSAKKVEEAEALHLAINKLKKDPGFLTDDEIQSLSNLVETSKKLLL
jgi:regulator of replication initiation timing